MVNYETFESSESDEEAEQDHIIFESEAQSFENKEHLITSQEKEAKRIERLKRKQRKLKEKI